MISEAQNDSLTKHNKLLQAQSNQSEKNQTQQSQPVAQIVTNNVNVNIKGGKYT